MKLKILGMLAVGLLVGPAVASATTVSWLFGGQITAVAGLPNIQVGNSFSFGLNFDSATPVSNPNACGLGGVNTECRHNGGPLFFSNIQFNGVGVGNFDPLPANNTTIIVRNDRLFNVGTLANPDNQIVDGYSFGATENYAVGRAQSFSIVFRGPEDLNMVTDGRLLPGVPPSSLLSLRQRGFELCDGDTDAGGFLVNCNYEYIAGTVTSVSSVPEPGSLALLGLGLAGLGLSRRRKA